MKHVDFWVCKFVLSQLLHYCWFQTFALFRMLCSFFWAIYGFLILCADVSGHCLFHLHRWCEQENFFPLTRPMKMKQCSKTSARKIQKPGNHPKKEYNFSIIRSSKGCIKIENMDLSKSSYCWTNYFSPAPNLVPVQEVFVDKRQAYSGTNPVHCYPHYQCRFIGFVIPNFVTLNKLCNRSMFWQTCCCLTMHEPPWNSTCRRLRPCDQIWARNCIYQGAARNHSLPYT